MNKLRSIGEFEWTWLFKIQLFRMHSATVNLNWCNHLIQRQCHTLSRSSSCVALRIMRLGHWRLEPRSTERFRLRHAFGGVKIWRQTDGTRNVTRWKCTVKDSSAIARFLVSCNYWDIWYLYNIYNIYILSTCKCVDYLSNRFDFFKLSSHTRNAVTNSMTAPVKITMKISSFQEIALKYFRWNKHRETWTWTPFDTIGILWKTERRHIITSRASLIDLWEFVTNVWHVTPPNHSCTRCTHVLPCGICYNEKKSNNFLQMKRFFSNSLHFTVC